MTYVLSTNRQSKQVSELELEKQVAKLRKNNQDYSVQHPDGAWTHYEKQNIKNKIDSTNYEKDRD